MIPTDTLTSKCFSVTRCSQAAAPRREEARPCALIAAAEPRFEMKKTLLDALSEEEGANVLRYLSYKPESEHWQRHMEEDDVLICVHPAHPMAETARKVFTRLVGDDEEDDGNGVVLQGDDTVLKWISRAGHSSTFLSLSVGETVAKKMFAALKKRCTSLRGLNISKVYCDAAARQILHATRGRLEKLVASGTHVHGIEDNCAGILDLELVSHPRTPDFLKVVGPTLQTLRILPFGSEKDCANSKKFLELMKAFCPCLSEISVTVDAEDIDTFAELLSCYGDKLRRLNMDQLPVDVRKKLVTACPKVKCTNGIQFDSNTGELGASVRRLVVCAEDSFDPKMMAEELQPCSEIEDITLHARASPDNDATYGVNAVKGIFKNRNPMLTKIYTSMVGPSYGDSVVMELSQHMNNVRSFSFTGVIDEVGVFGCLARNAPLLEYVYVALDGWLDVEEDIEEGDDVEDEGDVEDEASGDEAPESRDKSITETVACFAENCLNLRRIEVTTHRFSQDIIGEVKDLVRRLRLQCSRRKNGHRLQVVIDEQEPYNCY